MTGALRATWAIVAWLFLILIPIQFYLAGHGAFDFHNATAAGRDSGWDPHRALGDIMVLISLIQLPIALAGRLPRGLLTRAIGLPVLMILQYFLASLGDSVSTRFIAALHPVNGLAILGLTIGMVIDGRQYLPIGRLRPASGEGSRAN
jgi:Family of unknown function (DUF6220)